MFKIDANGNITMVAGDTGSITVACSKKDYAARDRALFTIMRADGTIVYESECKITNGEFTINFWNATTDTWPAGVYTYEVRYIENPYWEDDKLIDGDVVTTAEFDDAGSVTRNITVIRPIKEV